MNTMPTFADLAAINVNEHVEKKGQARYLSWAWAWDYIARLDNDAKWEVLEPVVYNDGTMTVRVAVIAFGRVREERLPVMDNRNKSIAHPDAFAVNTAERRCLVKAIASGFGLGLYLYAGEDLPNVPAAETSEEDEELLRNLEAVADEGTDRLKATWQGLDKDVRARLRDHLDDLKARAAKVEEVNHAA